MHKSGIFHRDIKPDNILINDDLSPTIIDFDLSREQGRNKEEVKKNENIWLCWTHMDH